VTPKTRRLRRVEIADAGLRTSVTPTTRRP